MEVNSNYLSVSSPGQRMEVYTCVCAYLPDSSAAFSYFSPPPPFAISGDVSSVLSAKHLFFNPVAASHDVYHILPLCWFCQWPLVIPAVLRCAATTTRCYPRFPDRSVLHVTTFLFYEFFMQHHRPQIDLGQRERGP